MTETSTREWGHRFVDGTAGPDESRESALTLAARFVPGFVEIVHRDAPDAPWVRADYQPHMPGERLDQLDGHIARTQRSNNWRGHRLVELGVHPNPPRDWDPVGARPQNGPVGAAGASGGSASADGPDAPQRGAGDADGTIPGDPRDAHSPAEALEGPGTPNHLPEVPEGAQRPAAAREGGSDA